MSALAVRWTDLGIGTRAALLRDHDDGEGFSLGTRSANELAAIGRGEILVKGAPQDARLPRTVAGHVERVATPAPKPVARTKVRKKVDRHHVEETEIETDDEAADNPDRDDDEAESTSVRRRRASARTPARSAAQAKTRPAPATDAPRDLVFGGANDLMRMTFEAPRVDDSPAPFLLDQTKSRRENLIAYGKVPAGLAACLRDDELLAVSVALATKRGER